jgi:hypothetical protein
MTDAPLNPREADDMPLPQNMCWAFWMPQNVPRLKPGSSVIPALPSLVVAWEYRMGGLNDGFAEAPAPNLSSCPDRGAAVSETRPRSGDFGGWFSGIFGWVSGALVGHCWFWPSSPLSPRPDQC